MIPVWGKTRMHAPLRQFHGDSPGTAKETLSSADIESIRARAHLLQKSKNFEAAAQAWRQIIERHPEDAEAMNELGSVFSNTGRFEEGLHWIRRALEIRPDLISAKANAGVALRHLSRFEEAVSSFKDVIASTPDDAIACFNLGVSLHSLQRQEEALKWLQRASDLWPDHGDSAHELGNVLQKLKRNEEAISAYRRAISLKPGCIAALLSLGGLLQEARQFEEASATFQKVVDIDPNHCNGWLSLGAALLGTRRHAESLAAFRRALAIQPGSVVAYCNMSLALMGLERFEEAIDACRKALFIEPGSPVATFNLGCVLLTLGNFREGWEAYEYRYAIHGKKWLCEEAHAAPWTGETLQGKSIVILGEQGNGDQIQFARYLPELSDLGASVSYLVPARLHRLFGTLRGSINLLSEIAQNSRFDFQCPLMSLPGLFDRLGLPIPTTTPYLAAEPERVARWKSHIGDHGFRVGIVWQGNRYPDGDVRSYQLDALRPLAAIPGVRLISLQINEGTEQLRALPTDMHVESLGPDFDMGQDAFLDAAAVLEVVDLLVTCDTSMVHLAGALHRTLWVALNDAPEWRWQRQRTDNIWYPTARLFRPEAKGDWDGVFSRMREALGELLENKATSSRNDVPAPPKSPPHVEVSWGELLDKITILEIKAERFTSPASVAHVRRELEHLKSVLAGLAPLPSDVETKRDSLRATNEKLWDIENAIRACEAEQRFDAHFIELARTIYALNDERARIKQEINAGMKSSFVEEKEYRSRSNRQA